MRAAEVAANGGKSLFATATSTAHALGPPSASPAFKTRPHQRFPSLRPTVRTLIRRFSPHLALPMGMAEAEGNQTAKTADGRVLNYVDHTYHDFSKFFEVGGEVVSHKKAGKNFPAVLHRILSEEAKYSHIITWMVCLYVFGHE